jgi:hypothetical protein
MSAAVSAGAMSAVVTILRWIRLARRWLSRARSDFFANALFDDLVEFSAIQPYAPALGTIVDLYALAVAHDEVDPAGGAKKTVACVFRGAVCDVLHVLTPVYQWTPLADRTLHGVSSNWSFKGSSDFICHLSVQVREAPRSTVPRLSVIDCRRR